jgi:hypothetical protein
MAGPASELTAMAMLPNMPIDLAIVIMNDDNECVYGCMMHSSKVRKSKEHQDKGGNVVSTQWRSRLRLCHCHCHGQIGRKAG